MQADCQFTGSSRNPFASDGLPGGLKIIFF